MADLVWSRFGRVRNYVEPFFGSGAMLFRRPQPIEGVETVNDADGLVANFWRAVQADPEAVAHYADWPVNENDLHSRHAWLVGVKDSLGPRLEGDPEWYDPKVAGWWAWGVSCWIGRQFCCGKGPWQVRQDEDGTRQLVHLGSAGQGVTRQLVHLGDAGQGVTRQLVHLGNAGRGVTRPDQGLADYFGVLADRLRGVRVCCGDWSRVMGPTPMLERRGSAHPIGIFLDPPYSADAQRDKRIYAVDSYAVTHAVREWALAHGDDPRYRIALCGYEGEHPMPASWTKVAWKQAGGYGSQSRTGYRNAGRERIWFSPHCLVPGEDAGLLDLTDTATAS